MNFWLQQGFTLEWDGTAAYADYANWIPIPYWVTWWLWQVITNNSYIGMQWCNIICPPHSAAIQIKTPEKPWNEQMLHFRPKNTQHKDKFFILIKSITTENNLYKFNVDKAFCKFFFFSWPERTVDQYSRTSCFIWVKILHNTEALCSKPFFKMGGTRENAIQLSFISTGEFFFF